MKNFKDYEELIRATVKKIDEEDTNWCFSVKSISKTQVRIRWTYLDYCEEINNCFFLVLSDYDEEYDEYWMCAKDPDYVLIPDAGYFCTEHESKKSWQSSYESAIVDSINAIAYYAHTRY